MRNIETGFKKTFLMKRITISKIAELAGVSKATVSRVLNGYPHIRPEIREKVQNVIAETGFQPNNVARLLASDRSNIIALIIPSGPSAVFTDPYFPVLTQSISQVANRRHQTLALFIMESEEEGREMMRNILGSGLVDGMIITADRKDASLMPDAIQHKMPFLVIGRPEYDPNVNYIDVDNTGGSYLATQHLIQLGYKRIATIASSQNTSGDDRYTGYCKALADHQIALDESLIAFGDYSLQSGYDATQKLLPARPDAIFVASDTMALGTLRALREAGLRVPQDVAIVGYDDLPPALQADPQLTTISQPVDKIGGLAVEMLMEIIEAPDAPAREIILPTELIVRASCGAVQLKRAYS